MPDAAIAINITGNDADAARMIARQQKDIDKLKGSYRDLAKQGKETGESLHIGSGVVGELAGLAAGYLSVSTILGGLAAAGETWKSILKETTQATREAVEQSRQLASLQIGDIRGPVMETLRTAREFGVKDRGGVLRLATELQAAQGGDAAAGQRELREALAVHRLTGAPLEDLGELGQLAGARGMDPGQLMREVATAGMETTVTPSTIMRGAKSIGAFGTPEDAIATLAILSKQFGPRGATMAGELPGLFGEGIPKDVAARLKRLGITKHTPTMEAVGLLGGAGITTVDKARALGFDLKQAELVAAAAEKQPAIMDLSRRLPGMSTEAAIETRYARMVREMPEIEQSERAARLEASGRDTLAFGPRATAAGEADEELLIKGLALRRMGMEEYLGARLVDESGRMTGGGPWRAMTPGFWARQAAGLEGPSTLIPPAKGEYTRAEEWRDVIRAVREELHPTAASLDHAAGQLRGGPALVPADVDR